MIKAIFLLRHIVFALVLASCAKHQESKPLIIEDAGNYSNEGVQAYAEADWYRAKQLFTRALILNQGIDNQAGIINAYINLIEVALSERDYQTAQRYLQSASGMTQTAALNSYQNRISLLSSQLALLQKQYLQAERLLQSLLPEFSELKPASVPDEIQLAAIANRTRIAFVQQQHASLWTHRYEQALKISGRHAPALEARLLRFQAALLLQEKKYQNAADKLQQALINYKAGLTQSGIAATLSELGDLYLQQGRWQQAQHYLRRANVVLRHTGDRDMIIHNTEQLAVVEARLGNIERSRIIKEWLSEIKKQPGQSKKSSPLLESADYLH